MRHCQRISPWLERRCRHARSQPVPTPPVQLYPGHSWRHTCATLPCTPAHLSPRVRAQRRDMHLTETHLSSSEVRDRIMRAWGSAPTDGGGVKRGADDIVRYGLRHGLERDGGEDVVGKAWYDEAEGLVPPSVLGHIVRYGLYQRE